MYCHSVLLQELASSDFRLNYRLREACGGEVHRLCPDVCGNLKRERASWLLADESACGDAG